MKLNPLTDEIYSLRSEDAIADEKMINLMLFTAQTAIEVSSGGLLIRAPKGAKGFSPKSGYYGSKKAFPGYSPSETTYFSGVYNVKNGRITYQPSGSTRLSNGQVPHNLVGRNTGHRTVLTNSKGSFKDNVAFTLHYRSSKELIVGFKSSSVTRQFNRQNGLGRSVFPNEEIKSKMISSLRRAFPNMKITPKIEN
ncbi:hypothetical protein [Flammeovirga sp. EKP202]|uniref:hypothetical protein n=1 Tax=Flammeovirga sp. EKP202 TaxID=2770592 RepID=UPI001CB85ADC|nr:hypothetical protein [Flammeovirga sp. EKP202]